MIGISAFDPKNNNFLNAELIQPFALAYRCDVETLNSELKIIKKSIKQLEIKHNNMTNIFELHEFLIQYELAFSELYKLCTIAITIPVSSAVCERTFSCMKRIKTYLRNSMLQINLSNLSIISIEKSEAKHLNINSIIDNFADSHNNRRIILK